jgi:AAA family ATP:ADP antiporter
VPWVYLFFIANLLIFYALFQQGVASDAVARAFFVWVSVFNLFVVSVFWSFMVDIYTPEQAKRLFGVISAGGTCGALAGPTLTAWLAAPLGIPNLLLVSCAFLLLSLICLAALLRWASTRESDGEPGNAVADVRIGGTTWSGMAALLRSPYLLGIVAYILLYTVLLGFSYFETVRLVSERYSDSAERTTLFAQVDLTVNVLTLLGQVFLVSRLVERLGVGIALCVLPALALAGFATMSIFPVLAVLVIFQVLRRAAEYAVARPAREMLFSVVDRDAKYKSKNFIDTVVFRGGDAASGWLYAAMKAAGLGLVGMAAVAIPGALVWLALALVLGRQHARQQAERNRAA